jgi:hypothetical protein
VRARSAPAWNVQRRISESALLYVSELADADPAAVDRIVDMSRVRNQRDQVTGLLMFDGRRFAQWIEGPSKAIDRLLQRLRADARHRRMDVLWFESPGLGRRFPNWAFGYLTVEPNAGAIERLSGTRGADAMLLFGDLAREAAHAYRWPPTNYVPFGARRAPFAGSPLLAYGAGSPTLSPAAAA